MWNNKALFYAVRFSHFMEVSCVGYQFRYTLCMRYFWMQYLYFFAMMYYFHVFFLHSVFPIIFVFELMKIFSIKMLSLYKYRKGLVTEHRIYLFMTFWRSGVVPITLCLVPKRQSFLDINQCSAKFRPIILSYWMI